MGSTTLNGKWFEPTPVAVMSYLRSDLTDTERTELLARIICECVRAYRLNREEAVTAGERSLHVENLGPDIATALLAAVPFLKVELSHLPLLYLKIF